MLFGLSYEAIGAIGGGILLLSLALGIISGHWIFLLSGLVGLIFLGVGLDCIGTIPDRTCYPEVVPAMLPLTPEKKDALIKGIVWLILGSIALPLLHTFRKSEETRLHGRERLNEIKEEAEKNNQYPVIRWAINENDPSQGFEVHIRNKTTGKWNWHFEDKDGKTK